MSDTRKPRAVSGEIMTGSLRAGEAVTDTPAPDIVDADYVTLDGTSSYERPGAARAPHRPGATVSGLDTLMPRSAAAAGAHGAERQRGGALFWATGLVVVFTAFWISGGHALVGRLPFLTAPHAAAVRVASVTSRIEKGPGGAVLFVDGETVNDAADARPVPALSINVLGKDGHTTRYLLGTTGSMLAPGEHLAFSSRLIAPNAGVESVSVTIEEQQD